MATEEFGPGHPWYYRDNDPVPVDEIQGKPRPLGLEYYVKPIKDQKKYLDNLKKYLQGQKENLNRDIARYNELLEKGENALSDFDKRCGFGLETAFSLVHNHIAYNKSVIIHVENGIKEVEDANPQMSLF